jgi:serine/threonine protein kinase
MRFAAPVFVNRYNQTQERAAESASISDSPPRVASFRTPSGSSALQFGGPWICMSPERVLGLECSYSSDVWSLGVCLLHLALGRCPYLESETRSINALKNAVIGGALRERLWKQEKELLDENFQAFIDACLHPMPQKRPSLSSLLADFPFVQKGQMQSQERLKSWLIGDTSFFAEDAAVAAHEELQRYMQLAQRTVTSGALMHVFSNAHIENRMPHVPVSTPLRLNPTGVVSMSSVEPGASEAPKFVAWAKYGPSCNLEPLLSGSSASVWALMVNADKQRGCFHLCLQSGERVDVLASSEEQAVLWVKGVSIVLEAAEMQKTSIKNTNKQIFSSRVKQNEESLMNKPMTPPQPSLPTISQARTSGNKMGADGLLDVAAMKWQRIQV